METKYFEEKNMDDAPLELDNGGASNWANGYNSCLEKTNAKELLEALIEAKIQIEYLHSKFKETGSGNMVLNMIENAINKATK